MSSHRCTGDVDTCPTCAGARDRIEWAQMGGVIGWSDNDLDDLADAAAAREVWGR